METECEIFWVKINIVGCKTLCVCAFYNPDEGDAISLKNFERSLQWIGGMTSSHIWIAGDVNLPGFDWKYSCIFPRCHFPELTRKFSDCLNHGVVQLINNPTWGRNVLDLFIINDNSLIIKTEVVQGTCISDHDAVFVEGNIKAAINKQKCRMVPLYREADWDGLTEHMLKYVDSVVYSTDCDLAINDL